MTLEQLGQRLSLLQRQAQDLPERQRTLKAAIAWSYEPLAPEEQTLLRRLGVFVGNFSLDAAEAIAEDMRAQVPGLTAVEGLASLVDKSLVQVRASCVPPWRGCSTTTGNWHYVHLRTRVHVARSLISSVSPPDRKSSNRTCQNLMPIPPARPR